MNALQISVARPAWKANIHSNLYVANLPTTFSEKDIKAFFGDFEDKIEHLRMLKDSRSVSKKGFRGIVVMRDERITDGLALEVLLQISRD